MTEVKLFDCSNGTLFREIEADKEKDSKLTAWWQEFSQSNPHFFNGELIACDRCAQVSSGEIQIDWFRTTYSHYLQRTATNPVVASAKALYCSVAVTTDRNRLLIGRMNQKTSSPGRLQLPGGNISLEKLNELTIEHCRRDACRELLEETGLNLEPNELRFWLVKTDGVYGDIGIIFKSKNSIREDVILQKFELLQSNSLSSGGTTEFEEILFLDNQSHCLGKSVDYLEAVLAHHSRNLGG